MIALSLVIIAHFITRGNDGQYRGTRPAPFKPLTEIEIKRRDPFIVKFGGKWAYVCKLAKTCDLVNLFENKDLVLEKFDPEKKGYDLEIGLFLLRELMYQIGEKPRGWFKRFQYRMAFHSYFRNNASEFMQVFNDMLHYQTHLFFLLNQTKKMIMSQVKEYSRIDSDAYYQAQAHGPKYISNIFLQSNTGKNNQDIQSTCITGGTARG